MVGMDLRSQFVNGTAGGILGVFLLVGARRSSFHEFAFEELGCVGAPSMGPLEVGAGAASRALPKAAGSTRSPWNEELESLEKRL